MLPTSKVICSFFTVTSAPPLILRHDCCHTNRSFSKYTNCLLFVNALHDVATYSQAPYFYKHASDLPLRLHQVHPNFKQVTANRKWPSTMRTGLCQLSFYRKAIGNFKYTDRQIGQHILRTISTFHKEAHRCTRACQIDTQICQDKLDNLPAPPSGNNIAL